MDRPRIIMVQIFRMTCCIGGAALSLLGRIVLIQGWMVPQCIRHRIGTPDISYAG